MKYLHELDQEDLSRCARTQIQQRMHSGCRQVWAVVLTKWLRRFPRCPLCALVVAARISGLGRAHLVIVGAQRYSHRSHVGRLRMQEHLHWWWVCFLWEPNGVLALVVDVVRPSDRGSESEVHEFFQAEPPVQPPVLESVEVDVQLREQELLRV